MLDFYLKGGVLMHPILFVSILALSISLERFWYFRCLNTGKLSKQFLDIEKALHQQDKTQAQNTLKTIPSPLSQILKLGLDEINPEHAAEKMAIAGEKSAQEAQKGLSLLALIPSIATMLGLLGTVLGLALAFKKVALLEGNVSPALLASGIWVALITTVAGLIVAIPTLISHHFLQNKLSQLHFEIEHYGSRLLLLKKMNSEGAQAPKTKRQKDIERTPFPLALEKKQPLG